MPLTFSGPGTYEFGGSLSVYPVSISISLLGTTSDFPTSGNPFFGSLRWNGITGIALPKSREHPRFTVTSASGFNYALAAPPVPEPETLVLILVGLAGVAWSARRRGKDGRFAKKSGSNGILTGVIGTLRNGSNRSWKNSTEGNVDDLRTVSSGMIGASRNNSGA